MIERLSKSRVIAGSETDIDRHIEEDFLIRSGLCPNKCGLLNFDGKYQHCPECGFHTNCKPESNA